MEIAAALDKLGAKSFVFSLGSHEIAAHLLNVKEELRVDRLTKEYEGTAAYSSALQTATFALSVDSIDGAPFFQALSSDSEETAFARFRKALDFYRTVIALFFEEYAKRQEEEAKLVEDLKKKSVKSLEAPSPRSKKKG